MTFAQSVTAGPRRSPRRPPAGVAGPPAAPSAAGLDVRPGRPGDVPALGRFLARCSVETLVRRFHGAAGPQAAEAIIGRTAHPSASHRGVVAIEGGEVRGVGTLAFGPDGEAEIAFVVEDAWMRRGIGQLLARGVVREARQLGVPRLVAYLQPDNVRARAFYRSIATGATIRLEDRELIVDIPLPVDHRPRSRSRSRARPPTRDLGAHRQELSFSTKISEGGEAGAGRSGR